MKKNSVFNSTTNLIGCSPLQVNSDSVKTQIVEKERKTVLDSTHVNSVRKEMKSSMSNETVSLEATNPIECSSSSKMLTSIVSSTVNKSTKKKRKRRKKRRIIVASNSNDNLKCVDESIITR